MGKSDVCNLTTNEFKVFTPPYPRSKHCFSGLGYDPKSDDYKLIRNHYSCRTTEVYSFESDSWKVIPGPGHGTVMYSECGVYIDGRCYWVTLPWTEGKGFDSNIVLFGFSDETFYRSPLPPLGDFGSIGLDIRLFDYEGCLSVVGYRLVEDDENMAAMYFEVHVQRITTGPWDTGIEGWSFASPRVF
ncbi:hypothetical protein OROMI_016080 [Orobanche minor]